VPERFKGLVVARRRGMERRTADSPRPGLLAVGHSLVPYLTPQGVVGQAFDLLGQAIGSEAFEGLDNARMQHPPPLQQEAAVCHLVRQGMLERVLDPGKEASLIEELRGLQVSEAVPDLLLRLLGDGLQQGQRDFPANDGRGLEQALRLN
jgi:hypothetical protein